MLNDLIRVSEDGEQGFRLAAEKASDPELKMLFSERAQTCQSAAGELQSMVRQLGGKPEHGGSMSGSLHRGWVKAKTAVSSDDDVAVLEELERGEDMAKAAYARALSAELPEQIREVIDQQYSGVLQNHNRVRNLRDIYQQGTTH